MIINRGLEMPGNKKHHYVPRMYLRQFGHNNGRSIHIYNLLSKKTIPHGNLKNQCYTDYLYGKDTEVEKDLGRVESAAATVMSSIIRSKRLPPQDTEHSFHLLTFVLYQKNRTPEAGAELNEQLQNIYKHFVVPQHEAEAAKSGISRQLLEEGKLAFVYPETAALTGTIFSVAPQWI